VQKQDPEDVMPSLNPPPDDYLVFEPTTIQRKAPPSKPKVQLSLF
jgi:hypothetical protein